VSEDRATEQGGEALGEGMTEPFARAGLALKTEERARLAEPIRLFEAMRSRLRAAAVAGEPATLFSPPRR